MEDNENKLKQFLKSLRMNESSISMFLGAMVVVVVGVLIYNYFTGVNKADEVDQIADEGVKLVEEGGELVPSALPVTHTVSKGEHLWQIAEKYYESGYNWVDIAEENSLVNPDILTEGQSLVIPRAGVIKTETESLKPVIKSEYLSSEHLVIKGDTLWNIAVKAYGDGYQWTRIWEANREFITDPNVIEAGMLLNLPR